MLSYTNRDYSSIRQNLIDLVPTLTDKWNDMSEADLGITFIELLSGVSAMLNFYIDKQSNETFINTARESKNIISILEQFGYKRPLRKAGVSTLRVAIPDNEGVERNVAQFSIPQFTQLYSQELQAYFFTLKEVIISPSTSLVSIPVSEGIMFSYTILRDDIKDYKYYLRKGDIDESNFKLFVNEEEWIKVQNAFLEYEGGKLFSVHRDAFDSHYILFSHDYIKHIPADAEIQIQYNTTQGAVNIPYYTSLSFVNPIQSDGVDVRDSLYLTLQSDFTGGYTDSDVYLEKAKLLKKAKSMEVLITIDDIEDFLCGYEGVKSVYVTDIATNPYVVRPYEINCYLSLNTGDTISDAFRDILAEDLRPRVLAPLKLNILDAVKDELSLKVTFKVLSEAEDIQSKCEDIQSLIMRHFHTMDVNEPLHTERIQYVIIQNIPGLYSVVVEGIPNPVPELGHYYSIVDVQVEGFVYEY